MSILQPIIDPLVHPIIGPLNSVRVAATPVAPSGYSVASGVVTIAHPSGIAVSMTRDTDAPSRKDVWRVTGCAVGGRAVDRANDSAWEHAFSSGGDWIGSSHGNEELSAASLWVDGIEVSLAADSSGQAARIELRQTTAFLDPVAETPVATVTTTHLFRGDILDIEQSVHWTAEVALSGSAYAAMFPASAWGANRGQRAPALAVENLIGADQAAIEGETVATYSAGGGFRCELSIVDYAGLPGPIATFVQTAANPNKSYIDVSTAVTPSVDDVWAWTSRYQWSAPALATAVIDRGYWDWIWDADEQGGDVATAWPALVASETLLPGVGGPTYGAAAFDGRAGVSFVDASSDYLLGSATMANTVDGDDTPFMVAMHVIFDSRTSSDTVWAFGNLAAGFPYIRLRIASTTSLLQLEVRDAANVLTSSGTAGTIATATEHTIVVVRHAATADVYVDGVLTELALALGTLGTLDVFALGALVRSNVANFAGMTVRRVGLLAGAAADAIAQADVDAIHAAWAGN